jgi:hypothetical protein
MTVCRSANAGKSADAEWRVSYHLHGFHKGMERMETPLYRRSPVADDGMAIRWRLGEWFRFWTVTFVQKPNQFFIGLNV